MPMSGLARCSIDGSAPDEAMYLQTATGGWTVLQRARAEDRERWFETAHGACNFLAERLLKDGGNRVN